MTPIGSACSLKYTGPCPDWQVYAGGEWAMHVVELMKKESFALPLEKTAVPSDEEQQC